MEFLKCSPKIQGNRLRLEDVGELENQARRVRVKLSLPSCKEGSEDLSPRIPEESFPHLNLQQNQQNMMR
jgi:hypothetical protein